MRKVLPVLIIFFIGAVLFGGLIVLKKEKPVEPRKEGGEIKVEPSGKKVLMVVAPQNFRDEELIEPKTILEENGISVEVASKGVGEAVGMFGAKALIDKDINEVNVDDYEAIVFIGGTGASVYFNDQTALNLAKTAFERGKIVGAICIAPSILANAGLLTGKKATAFSSESENLTARGAQYTGEAVTVDDKIVTARGPEAATEFGKKLAEVLK